MNISLNTHTASIAPQKEITVLLVEDNDIDVMGVKRAFHAFPLASKIIVVENGLMALEMLRDGSSITNPYLILLDINMPKMNGIEFLREIRKDPKLQKSVVFILTTSKLQSDIDQAYENYIAGYIVKSGRENGFLDVADLLNRYTEICEFP